MVYYTSLYSEFSEGVFCILHITGDPFPVTWGVVQLPFIFATLVLIITTIKAGKCWWFHTIKHLCDLEDSTPYFSNSLFYAIYSGEHIPTSHPLLSNQYTRDSNTINCLWIFWVEHRLRKKREIGVLHHSLEGNHYGFLFFFKCPFVTPCLCSVVYMYVFHQNLWYIMPDEVTSTTPCKGLHNQLINEQALVRWLIKSFMQR